MIVLATAAAFIGGLTADAFARGGGGFGAGAHMGGGGRGGFVRNPTTLLGSHADARGMYVCSSQFATGLQVLMRIVGERFLCSGEFRSISRGSADLDCLAKPRYSPPKLRVDDVPALQLYYRKFCIGEAIQNTVFRSPTTTFLSSDNLKGKWL
jgi:hypothetical protein